MRIQLSWKYPDTNYGRTTNAQYVKWVTRLGYTASFEEEGDLLLLMGGADIGTKPDRDRHELALIDKYIEAGKPIFGVCRGMQMLGLRYGCTFVSNIPDVPGTLTHTSSEEDWKGDSSWHKIKDNLGQSHIVNSRHHQGFLKSNDINMFCEEFCWSEDGIIEGIRGTDYNTSFSGVQWHPEREEVWDTAGETIAKNELYKLLINYSYDRKFIRDIQQT
jgi:gamma-glutamyl-gamma-aminobutyrate hydrolase PuuD